MKPKNLNFASSGPEEKILQDIVDYLTLRQWFVKRTHGNAYQSGVPDLMCWHQKYGFRLVEVKNPSSYAFTAAQMEDFPKITAFGGQIWILVAANDHEYQKLFKPANWTHYLKL